MMAAAAGRRPAAGEGVEHAEPERGPGRGRDVIAPGRAIEQRMDGATKGQIDELVTAAGAVVGRLADGGAAGSAGLVGGPVAGVRGGLTGRMVVGSGLLLVVVGVAFAVLLVSVAELRTATRLARHSQEVLVAANQLERLAIDLETGQRGFVITGQERFLGPWRAARVAVPGQASTLARLVAGDPAQQRRAQRLWRAVRSYVEDYSVGLVAAARRDPAAARTVAATQEGKRRVDAMRGEFDRLIGTEQGLAVARQQRAQGAARRAIGAAAGGLAGSVLLIGGLAGYLTRAIVRPVRSTAAVAGRLLGADAAHVLRYEHDATVTLVAGWSRDGQALPVGTRSPIGEETLSALMLRTGQPARTDSHADHPGAIGTRIRQLGIRSSVACPITVQGRLWGATAVSSTQPQPLPPRHPGPHRRLHRAGRHRHRQHPGPRRAGRLQSTDRQGRRPDPPPDRARPARRHPAAAGVAGAGPARDLPWHPPGSPVTGRARPRAQGPRPTLPPPRPSRPQAPDPPTGAGRGRRLLRGRRGAHQRRQTRPRLPGPPRRPGTPRPPAPVGR